MLLAQVVASENMRVRAMPLWSPVIAARDQPTVRFLLTPHRIDFWLGSIETSRSNRSLRQSFTFHFVVVASN